MLLFFTIIFKVSYLMILRLRRIGSLSVLFLDKLGVRLGLEFLFFWFSVRLIGK